MKLTMQNIAEKAGVSRYAVSAVIRNDFSSKRVSKEKQERIRNLIKQYNFIPNETAQKLVNKKTRTITLVVPSYLFFESEFNTILTHTLQEYLMDHNYTLQVTSLATSFKENRLIQHIHTDGIVIMFWQDTFIPIIKQLCGLEKPVLTLRGKCGLEGVSNVYIDNRAGMYDLTKALIAAGHRNIAHVNAHHTDVYHEEGLAGIRAAVQETKGITFRDFKTRVDFNNPTTSQRLIDIGKRGLHQVQKEFPRATAIMFNDDLEAMGAVKEARQVGIAVPGALSVTGNGGFPVAEGNTIGISTTESKAPETGQKAGEIMLHCLAGNSSQQVGIQTKAVIKESIGTLTQ